ncbi:MAG: serine/threonine-protein kinase [Phycisphaerales bacterium]|nr:serine/threonine-protein kinase [Phycisphaerales bacterium]
MTESDRIIPKEIGGYKIIDILGEGGMSVVYTAIQDHPRRKVALKVLRGGIFSPTASRRFHLEVEILGKLDHPWIAKVYDAGTHDDGNGVTPFFVMEHVDDALELTDYLEKNPPDRREVLKLFAMISSAIEHGHHRGIVHRDLKPGNILIDAKGEPKIIDFGVARSLDRGIVDEQAMTEAGRLVGTVQFMAPEQVDPKTPDIDARCDVYALGVVLYKMLTGRLPRVLEGLPIYEAVRQICEEEPVRPTVHDKTVDANIEAIIMKAIQNDREKRYQSAGAMGRDILRYLGDLPIKARKVGVLDRTKLFWRRHKIVILISSAAIIFAVVTLLAFLYWKETEDDQIKKLQAEVTALTEKQDDKRQTEEPHPEPKTINPLFTMPGVPNSVSVSNEGSIIAAAIGDEFYAWTPDGSPISLPPINVDPTLATLALSNDGRTLGIVAGTRCRIVDLGLDNNMDGKVVARFERPLSVVTSIAVTETQIAISGENMTLEIFELGQKIKRSASMEGKYECVLLPSQLRVFAATSGSVIVWTQSSFPLNGIQLRGVQEPKAIGSRKGTPVVVGSSGQVIVAQDEEGEFRLTLSLNGKIEFASINIDGTLCGCIVQNKVFRCNLQTGESEEVGILPAELGGININNNGEIICWSINGDVYSP